MRRTLAGIGTLIVALLLPAAAGAAVRKVELFGADSGNCTVSACRTIQYAANQGEAGDTVEIAQGFYIETVETTTNLDFVGAGDGSGGGSATVILGLDGSGAEGHPAFILPNGGSLKSLAAKGGEGAGGLTGYAGAYAIEFKPNGLDRDDLDLEAVSAAGGIGGAGTPFGAAGGGAILALATEGEKKVTAVDSSLASGEGGGFTTKTAVEIYGDAMRGEFVTSELEANGGLIATGLDVREGATASIEKSAVEGFYGAGAEGGFLTVRHSHIQGAQWGLVVDPGSSAPGGEATVIDSVVESNSTAAFVSSGVGSRISKLTALGSDFISAPGPEPAIEAAASTPEQPVRVSLKNSIVHDVTEGAEQQKDLVADSATIEADHSSFTTSFASGGGTAPSPGSGTNVAGDPGFAGPETLALAPSSALIDRGDPAIVESGETDFEGTPRSLDGNHDCIATPDIGALELSGQSSPPCPLPLKAATAIPIVSGFGITNRRFAPKGKKPAKASRVKRGTKFTYSLSEPAQVAIKIERRKPGKGRPKYAKVTSIGGQQRSGKDATPFSGKVRGKPLKPGRYRATIVATDAAGQASTPHQLNFKIIRG